MAIKNRITDVGNILDANYYQKTIETRKYQKKSQIELRNNIFITKGWTRSEYVFLSFNSHYLVQYIRVQY